MVAGGEVDQHIAAAQRRIGGIKTAQVDVAGHAAFLPGAAEGHGQVARVVQHGRAVGLVARREGVDEELTAHLCAY